MKKHATKIDELKPEMKRFLQMVKNYLTTGNEFDKVRQFVNANARMWLSGEGVEYRYLPSKLSDFAGKLEFTYIDGILTDIGFIPENDNFSWDAILID